MRLAPLFVVPALLFGSLAKPAAAQDMLVLQEPSPSPIFGFLGGGASFPLSESGDRFTTGWVFHGGLGYNFGHTFGLQAEGLWSVYGVKADALNATDVDASHRMQYGALDAVVHLFRGPFSAYVVGGGGIYYRRVELTQFAGTTVVPFCDPWLYYCYPSVASVEEVLGSRSSTDFGLNGGVGASYRITSGLKFYAEGRYHYMFGPEIGGENINGQYLPITVGLRFE